MKKLSTSSAFPTCDFFVSFPYRFRIVSVSFPYRFRIVLLSFSYHSPIKLLSRSGNDMRWSERRTNEERRSKGSQSNNYSSLNFHNNGKTQWKDEIQRFR